MTTLLQDMRRTMQPELRRHREVADAIGVVHLVRCIWEMQKHVEELVVVGAVAFMIARLADRLQPGLILYVTDTSKRWM